MTFPSSIQFRRLFLVVSVFFTIQTVVYSQLDTTFQEIEAVTVSSIKEKQIVFEDSKYYIVDFTLTEKNGLLLLKNRGKYYVYLMDEYMNLVQKLRIEQNASSLFEDCFGNAYLVATDSVYFILDEDSEISLEGSQPRAEFLASVEKCVGWTSEKIIFEEYTEHDQFHEYYTVDAYSGDRKTIYEINDSIRSRSLRDASHDLYSNSVTVPEKYRKYEVSAQDMSSGDDEYEEIKQYREMNRRQDRVMFFESNVILQEYNPLFVVHDTLYFFNHFEGRIDQLDANGKLLSSVEIDHQLNPGWDNQIYMDIADKRFYGLSVENGISRLTRISITDEEDNFSATITEHAHPKKVLIRNGYAYYTYKPNVDSNLNKLYRQKL